MAKLNFKDKWLLVTGASSGLGQAMARRLAANEQANLVIAARREERLQQLKEEIEAAHGTRVEIVPVDISQDKEIDILFARASEIADIYALVNNAGLTSYERSDFSHWQTYEKILAVDLKALIKLSLRFLAYFQQRGEGAILNITSLGAFIPMPYQAIYSASKHAAQAFSEALAQEYRKSGIVICTFAPGGIATEMNVKSGLDKKYRLDSPFNMDADRAARKAINAFKKGKSLAVPGLLNKLTLFLVRLFPRKAVARAVEIAYRPPN